MGMCDDPKGDDGWVGPSQSETEAPQLFRVATYIHNHEARR